MSLHKASLTASVTSLPRFPRSRSTLSHAAEARRRSRAANATEAAAPTAMAIDEPNLTWINYCFVAIGVVATAVFTAIDPHFASAAWLRVRYGSEGNLGKRVHGGGERSLVQAHSSGALSTYAVPTAIQSWPRVFRPRPRVLASTPMYEPSGEYRCSLYTASPRCSRVCIKTIIPGGAPPSGSPRG